MHPRIWLVLAFLLVSPGARAQSVNAAPALATVRATSLQADKLPQAPALRQLTAGAALRMLSMEGGWALVEPLAADGKPGPAGWLRTTALNLPGGSEASRTTPPTVGLRSLPARVNRHALIIGVSRYADAKVAPLPGVRIDRQSATQMAQAMQVPAGNITYLQDEQATGDAIRKALRDLTERVQDGDRVFIHYSGHGIQIENDNYLLPADVPAPDDGNAE